MKVSFLLVTLYPAIRFGGIEGAAIVVVGAGLLANPISNYFAIRLVEGSLFDLLRVISYPFVGSGIMAGCLLGFDYAVMPQPSVLKFVALVLVGGITYTLPIAAMNEWFGYDLATIYVEIRSVF